MDKKADPSLFVNDGSFMERFKRHQQEKEKNSEVLGKSGSGSSPSVASTPKTVIAKTTMAFKGSGSVRTTQTPSSGKLAFSLKQKSKLVSPPVKFSDEDEDEKGGGNSSDDGRVKRQKFGQLDVSNQLSQVNVAPPAPSDSTVKEVADRLALFVAKNGRQLEHMTRQKNPGNTPFKFLYDESCSDYNYYEYRVSEEEKALSKTMDTQTSHAGTTTSISATGSQNPHHPNPKYQTPDSALYEATENRGSTYASSQSSGRYGESSAPTGPDPLKMMEYYMKKAAQEEKLRPLKASKDEMPPPTSLQASTKKGHHMGDYIPPEELEKFLATCNDVRAQKAAKEASERNQIQADNVGHRLLSKMGWKEGEGLGSSRSGIAAPVMAGDVKKDHLGVGAHAPGEVTSEDDIYEQYKKRMMLGYKHRPNPLNNPRKSYY